MKKSLLALAFGGFGIGLTEFVVMGLLPDIAQGFSVSVPQMGHMISAYALGVVVGAPTLTSILGSHRPRLSLLILMALFTVFNGLSSFAPSYLYLVAARFLAGLPHGAFFGIGAVVASRVAGKGKEASAVAVMFAGLTIANVVGVPLATFLGHAFSWRIAFGLVAVVGVVTLVAVSQWIPDLAARSGVRFRDDLRIFRRSGLWFALGITCIGTGGFFAWMSYIAPLFIHVSGFSPDLISVLMMVIGVGMTVGIFWGGKLSDRFTPLRAIVGLMLVLTLVLALNWVFAASQPMIVILAFITGVVAMAVCPPVQVLLIGYASESEMLGASLGQAGFNVGNALGAYFGSIPLVLGYSFASPQLVGGMMTFTGAMIGLVLYIREKSKFVRSSPRIVSGST